MKAPYFVPLSIFCLLMFCDSSFAEHQRHVVHAVEHECTFRLEELPGDWTKGDIQAWEEGFCIGKQRVDFTGTDEGNCGTTEVSPSFIRHLLTFGPMRNILDYYSTSSMTLQCAALQDHLDLQKIRSDMQLSFDRFLFPKGISTKDSSLHGLEISNSKILGDFDGRGMKTSGRVSFEDNEFVGNILLSGADVSSGYKMTDSKLHGDFNGGGMKINGRMHFEGNDFEGDILLDTVNVSDYISINDAMIPGGKISLVDARVGRSVHIDKCMILGNIYSEGIVIDLAFADIGRELQVHDCNIKGDLRGYQARIGELIIIDSHIDGNIKMQRIHITGPARMRHFTVKGYIDAIQSFVGKDMWAEYCQVNGAGTSDSKAAFEIVGARISGGMIFGNCTIEGNVRGVNAHVAALSIFDSKITGKLLLLGMQVDKSVTLTEFEGNTVLGEVDGSNIFVGKDVLLRTAGWKAIDLRDSEVKGMLKLKKCLDDGERRKIILRNAYMNGIDDKINNKINEDCMWENLDIDLIGWTYDGAPLVDMSARKDDFLTKWISEKTSDSIHVPQPYLQFAKSLEAVGLMEQANKIRIIEREMNLAQLEGLVGFWQWIVAKTTLFGYKPLNALVWFVVLILFGTGILVLTDCKYGAELREQRKKLYLAGWVVVVLVAVVVVGVDALYADTSNWDWKGYGWIVVCGLIFAWGAFGARRERVNPPKLKRELWKGVFLYSMDRAVPFLGFDGEHIRWFEETQRLNDMPLVCIYFYLHSILGLALISLFAAGLTGVLR